MRSSAVVALVFAGCAGSPRPASPPPPPTTTTPAPRPAPRPDLEAALAPASEVVGAPDQPGDETALNSKRWVYASYFNRFKRSVAAQWDPQSVWRRLGSPATAGTRATTVRVELAAQTGNLVRALVTSPSGVMELDEEALRSLRAASPYGESPVGLAQNGVVKFEFVFYFEIGTQQGSVNRVPVAPPP